MLEKISPSVGTCRCRNIGYDAFLSAFKRHQKSILFVLSGIQLFWNLKNFDWANFLCNSGIFLQRISNKREKIYPLTPGAPMVPGSRAGLWALLLVCVSSHRCVGPSVTTSPQGQGSLPGATGPDHSLIYRTCQFGPATVP